MKTTLSTELAVELMELGNTKNINTGVALTGFVDENLKEVVVTAINSDFIRCEVRYKEHAKQEIEVYKHGSINARAIDYGVFESIPVQAFKLVTRLHKLLNKG